MLMDISMIVHLLSLLLLFGVIAVRQGPHKTARSSISDWAKERLIDRQKLPPKMRNSLDQLITNEIPHSLTYPKQQVLPETLQRTPDPFPRKLISDILPYPTYTTPPQTSFSCSNVKATGFYADTETGCQVIRRCTHYNFMFTYICPNKTLFNQASQSCDYWYNVNCPRTLQQLDDSPPDSPITTKFEYPLTRDSDSSRLKITDKSSPLLSFSDDLFRLPDHISDSQNEIRNPARDTDKHLTQSFSMPNRQPSNSNSPIQTLMQWVGENPIWTPRPEQLQFLNNQPSPFNNQQPSDRETITTVPPPRVVTSNRKSLIISNINTASIDSRGSLSHMLNDFKERMNREQLMFMMNSAKLDSTTAIPSTAASFVVSMEGSQSMPLTPTPAFEMIANQTTDTINGNLKNKQLGTPWIPLADFG